MNSIIAAAGLRRRFDEHLGGYPRLHRFGGDLAAMFHRGWLARLSETVLAFHAAAASNAVLTYCCSGGSMNSVTGGIDPTEGEE